MSRTSFTYTSQAQLRAGINGPDEYRSRVVATFSDWNTGAKQYGPLFAASPDLLHNCEVMHSRVKAILACDEAMDALSAEDVFGPGYPELLAADEQALREAIKAAGGNVEA